MLLGVLSDTHDQYARTRAAIELLRAKGVGAIVHCGDLCSEPILDLLAGELPAWFVFGNNDWDTTGLANTAKHLGLTCLGSHGVIELAGRKIGVAHGDRQNPLRELTTTPGLRWLLTGHTHHAHDDLEGTIRYVNPGALHRTRSPSVATIDLINDAVLFHGV